MPLSEHEQRILAELEESLVREDPEFAERVQSETVYRHAGRHCKWAAVAFILGAALMVWLYPTSVFLGFIGAAIMFVAAVVFERNLRRMGKASWHDLTRSHRHDDDTPGSTARLESAVNDAREWFKHRFNRGDSSSS